MTKPQPRFADLIFSHVRCELDQHFRYAVSFAGHDKRLGI